MICPPAYFDHSCNGCGKFGHTIESCWRNVTCQWCGRFGHIAAVCFHLRRSFANRNQNSYTRKKTKKKEEPQNWRSGCTSNSISEASDSGYDSDNWSYRRSNSESSEGCNNQSIHSWVQEDQQSKVASKVGTVFPDWQEQRQKQLSHLKFVESWLKPTSEFFQVQPALSAEDEYEQLLQQWEKRERSSLDGEVLQEERKTAEKTEATQPYFMLIDDHEEIESIMSSYLPPRSSFPFSISRMKWRNVLGKYSGPLLVWMWVKTLLINFSWLHFRIFYHFIMQQVLRLL